MVAAPSGVGELKRLQLLLQNIVASCAIWRVFIFAILINLSIFWNFKVLFLKNDSNNYILMSLDIILRFDIDSEHLKKKKKVSNFYYLLKSRN